MSSDKSPTCPICEKKVEHRRKNPSFPFCSRRCKREDLGKWLGGDYSVAGPPASPHDMAEELSRSGD